MSLKGKLSALRFGSGSRQHLFMSAGVIVAAVVLVSFLTWLNDAHKPIVRSIEEAVESSLPEALEQVDDQVATLLGVDEESVRSMRESVAGLVTSRPERILEIATGQPVSASAAAPASEDPSSPAATDVPPTQTMSEPSPTTDTPPPTTSEPAPPPATDTSPPSTEEPSLPAPEEPSPPAEVPSPPATEEPPPAAGAPAPPKEEPSPPAKGEQPPATKTSP